MADEQQSERTEEATPKRRAEARNRGQVLKSQEVTVAFTLLTGLSVIAMTGPRLFDLLGTFSRTVFTHSADFELTTGTLPGYLLGAIKLVAVMVLPLAVSVLVAALAANILQVGFLFTTETLKPKFEVLNPLNGFKRLLSVRSLVELAKAVAKIVVVLSVAYLTLKGSVAELSAAALSPLSATLALSKSLFLRLALRILAVFAVIAALDWLFQRWDFEKNLMMSREDVKEENRQSDGNPQVKGKIRQLQIASVRRRMMAAVKTADVVVTNPTHVAVALSYKSGEMSAPTVVAKGVRLLAQRIKAIAREHGVPMVEDKPLARALYKSVEIGQPVPPDLYRAVAEVLAYVYRLRGRKS